MSGMRFRVDMKYGYASFSTDDAEKAYALYEQEGIRIRLCKNIFDEGDVIEGLPIVQDLSVPQSWEVN